MKKILLVLALFITSCTSETKYGPCVGLSETENPKLIYKTDVMNVVMAVIFVETVFVPLIVVLSELDCPVGRITDNNSTSD